MIGEEVSDAADLPGQGVGEGVGCHQGLRADAGPVAGAGRGGRRAVSAGDGGVRASGTAVVAIKESIARLARPR
eukprot:COSAG01_NODE_2602_length_7394_cov_2.281563_10_plen_74_part_00